MNHGSQYCIGAQPKERSAVVNHIVRHRTPSSSKLDADFDGHLGTYSREFSHMIAAISPCMCKAPQYNTIFIITVCLVHRNKLNDIHFTCPIIAIRLVGNKLPSCELCHSSLIIIASTLYSVN